MRLGILDSGHIFQVDAPDFYATHLNELAIRGADAGIPAIVRKHEPVARCHVNGLPLMDGEGVRLRWRKTPLFAACVASDHRASVNTADSERLVFLYAPCCPMNYQHLPLTVVRQITFQRFRPLQRDVSTHLDARTQATATTVLLSRQHPSAPFKLQKHPPPRRLPSSRCI